MSHARAKHHGRGGAPGRASGGPPGECTFRIAQDGTTGPTGLPGTTAGRTTVRLGVEQLQEIKQQIAAGTYLTDEKLEVAIDRLLIALEQGNDPVERATA